MNCPDVRRLLNLYTDGELDLVRQIEIDEHLAGCAACAEQEKNLRSLRETLSAPALYHRAPVGLRERIQLSPPAVVPLRRRSPLRRVAIAAGILLLVGTSALVGMLFSRAGTSPEDRIADQVVVAHVRSLQVQHLTDVPSSDRHAVKPWFQGKLDFSPKVPDLAAQGYTLAGGRLDYLADRPVAALVYYRRLHAINLFIWPVGNDEEKPPRMLARQGFHMREWQRSRMNYWAISDLNDQELDEFVKLINDKMQDSQP